MKTGMKTIEELKQEVYDHGLNDHIREIFLGVLEDADVMSLTPKEREIYDARLKRYRDNRACLDYAIEKGVREGLEKGMEKGQQEEKLRIAKSMKEKNIDSATIAQCTNLTIGQVEAL